ncbi:MAG: DNA polymerase II small subunit, partial [Methanothrix sp.]|nr:DNA polymerase II small subunit [Methanothrix sp.]
MQQMSPRGSRPLVGQDIVQRLAEQGYQLEPEALEIICRYPGSKEELLTRIISSADRSVAVIGRSMVSCHLEPAAAKITSSARVAASSPSLPPRSSIPSNPQLSSLGPSHPPPTSFPNLPDLSAKLKCDITGRSTCVGDYN